MNWINQWIKEVLRDIPNSGYRARTEKELRDHMETQYEVLTEGGWTEEESRGEVLRVMGEPEQLQKEYKTTWRQSPRAKFDRMSGHLVIITGGCIITSVLHFGIGLLLFWLQLRMEDRFLRGSLFAPQNLLFFLLMLFLVPYSVEGLYLHFCVKWERHPIGMVTVGLLVAWLAERALPFLMCMVDYNPTLSPEFLEYLSNSTVFPIFSPVYMVASFADCILMGQFFGRFIERDEVEMA